MRHDPEQHHTSTREGARPSDTEALVGETAASEPLTSANRVQPGEAEARRDPADARRGEGGVGGVVPTDRQGDRDEELGHS